MTALFGQYSDERRDAIVDDLLKKRPAGGGDRAGIEFYTEHDYCDRYNQYRELFRCNKAYWGYTPLEVMRLGFTGSSGVEEYIIKRFYPGCDGRWNMTSGQKAGVARKANRIWDRIGDVARAKHTLPGVYEINAGSSYYAPTVGYVIADNRDHASQLGTTMFGVFAPDAERFVANWVGFPQVELLEKKATKLQASFLTNIEKLKKKYVEDLAALEQNARAASMAQMVALDLAETLREGAA